MPRPPNFKSGKKSAVATEPSTLDDFLEAGVTHEESAEKWRAGDAAKAARFYQRALDVYEKGLQVAAGAMASASGEDVSNRFDLEYNRARVLYTITQYPHLREAFSTEPLTRLLVAALEAHRVASRTAGSMVTAAAGGAQSEQAEAAYADVLFNESQVLCSLVEAAQDERPVLTNLDILGMTSEAADKFEECLRIQEQRYEKWRMMMAGENAAGWDGARWFLQWQKQQSLSAQQAGEDTDMSRDQVEQEQSHDDSVNNTETVAVMETATPRMLVETWLELVRALRLHYESLPTSGPAKRDITGDMKRLVDEKGQQVLTLLLLNVPEQHDPTAGKWAEDEMGLLLDTAIATMELLAVVTGELQYRSRQISAAEYAKVANEACDRLSWSHLLDDGRAWIAAQILAKPERACACAQVLSECAATMEELEPGQQSSSTRWAVLTRVLELLAAASRSPGVDRSLLARIHQRRGDVELERLSAVSPSTNADKTKQTLLRNAEVYYRGAAATAQASVASSFNHARHPDQEIVSSASVRRAVAAALTAGDRKPLQELATTLGAKTVQQEVERLAAEEVVQASWLADIGLSG